MTALYRRTTREISLAELPPKLRVAIETWAAEHQLVLGASRCFLTHSENPPSTGFFGKLFGSRANSVDPDAEHDSVLVLHPTHLVLATSGEKRGTSALGVSLDRASVIRGSALAAKLGPAAPADDGITITGFPGDEGREGSYFFGLGAPVADACFQALEGAIRNRKNP